MRSHFAVLLAFAAATGSCRSPAGGLRSGSRECASTEATGVRPDERAPETSKATGSERLHTGRESTGREAGDGPARAAGTRVVLLGTGTPVPDPERSGPAVAVVAGGWAYLVDTGPGVVRRAAEAFERRMAALDFRRLDRLFVTHLHSDHTAGYPDLLLTPATVGRRQVLQVYGPPGIESMTESLLLAYRVDLETRRGRGAEGEERGTGVAVHEIGPGVVYQDRRVKVTAFAVSHGTVENALGYRFDAPDRSIVVSGDTSPADSVVEACSGCDVLVHEVYCQEGFERGPPGFRRYHSTHHTSAVQLAGLAERARPGLLVLYHLLFFECPEEKLLTEIRRRYPGQVVLGTDLAVY